MLEQGSWGKSWAVWLTLDGIIYKPFHWQSWTDWEKQQSSLRDDGKKIEWIPNIRFSSFILNQFELQIPIWFTNSKFSLSMFNIYTDINLMLKVADVEATSAAWICCLLLKPAVILSLDAEAEIPSFNRKNVRRHWNEHFISTDTFNFG